MRLALFQPDIPQNLGAALRLGACLEVAVDVIEPCAFPLSDKSLKRAALDYGGLCETERHPSWAAFLAAPSRKAGRLVLFTTRYSSVASLTATAFAAVVIMLTVVLFQLPLLYAGYAVGAAGLIWLFHIDNIQRLLAGTERRIEFRRP